jgi:ribosomal protein S27E
MGRENENLEGENMIKHKFKKDRYVKARGGSSEFMNIYCSNCESHVALYQKDGQGSLIRMYLDRIFEPANLAGLQDSSQKSSLPSLKCPSCNNLLATPMVYKSENRLALRIIRGAIYKKKSDGTYPPK